MCMHYAWIIRWGYLAALWVFPNCWETDHLILLVARNWVNRGMDEADNFVSPSNNLPHWARLDLISRGWGINGWLWKGDMHLAGNNHIRRCTAALCGLCAAEWFKASRSEEIRGNDPKVLFPPRQQIPEGQLHSAPKTEPVLLRVAVIFVIINPMCPWYFLPQFLGHYHFKNFFLLH